MTVEHWEKLSNENLKGLTIVKCYYMSREVADSCGFSSLPLVIELSDGTCIYPMRDDEGNDAGAFGTNVEGFETIPVI